MMNANTYEQLMAEWKSNRPDYEDFCEDGILIETEWEKANPKILFLLKEPNSDFISIRGKGYSPKTGSSHVFWRNINIWQYVITECWNKRAPVFERISDIKEREVNSIAYVNVKKNNENKAKSDNADLLTYVNTDKEFLAKQIELINPKVILCGGTIGYFEKIMESEKIDQNILTSKDRLILGFYHPAARESYEESFWELFRMMNNEKLKSFLNK